MKRFLATLISTVAGAAISVAANAQTPDQIAVESKRANEFFDK